MDSVKLLNNIIKKELICNQFDGGQKLMNLFELACTIYTSNVLDIVKKYPNITIQDLSKLLPIEVSKLGEYSKLLAIEIGYDFFEDLVDVQDRKYVI